MSKVRDWVHQKHEESLQLLEETQEDAHVHSLFIKQCEYKQHFLHEHVPDNIHRTEMFGHIQRLRELIGKALEHKA